MLFVCLLSDKRNDSAHFVSFGRVWCACIFLFGVRYLGDGDCVMVELYPRISFSPFGGDICIGSAKIRGSKNGLSDDNL